MVNAPKKNFVPLPAHSYAKSTKQSIQQCHQPNEEKRGLEAERVRAFVALHCLRLNRKLAAQTGQEMHFSTNQEKVKWIGDYVERETA
jgi:hypothetical protein